MSWVDHVAALDPGFEIGPGVRAADTCAALDAPAPPGCTFHPSVRYGRGGGRPLMLELFTHDDGVRRPMFLAVHGGGWSIGDASMVRVHAKAMAAHGYVAASVGYRLSGEAPWPAALEDVKCALRWLRAHAAEIGGDPARVAVCGSSAGGQLAALAAFTPGRFEGCGGQPGSWSGADAVVLWYPVLDLTALLPTGLRPRIEEFLPGLDPAALALASPVTHAGTAQVPVLTLTGDADPVAPLPVVERFHESLRRRGVRERVHVIPGMAHGCEGFPPYGEQGHRVMREFLDGALGAPPAPRRRAAARAS